MLEVETIQKWFDEYDEEAGHDSWQERHLLRRARNITKHSEFKALLLKKNGILEWKVAIRTKRYYDSLMPRKWGQLFILAKESKKDPREAVKEIRAFSLDNMSHKGRRGGISYPVASTLAYFFSGGRCPIIDWRAVFTLKKKGYSRELSEIYLYLNKSTDRYQITLDDSGWVSYYNLCCKIVEDLAIQPRGYETPLRVLDKALWTYPSLMEGRE